MAATLLLVFIEYNSGKSINALVDGNTRLIKEFNVNDNITKLERDILSLESKIRGAVAANDTIYLQGLDTEILRVETEIGELEKAKYDDSSTVGYITELDTLVHQKLQWSRFLLHTFLKEGQAVAEKLLATRQGKMLTDSIIAVANKIDSARKRHLVNATVLIDKNSEKAKRLSATLIILVLVCGAGLFWYIITIIRRQISLIHQLNISEQKEKEAAQVKENFMANMSHEIRTPMNAILGFTNLLQRKNLDEESREYVQTIQKSGENLLTIINDILDLSKIEAGMMRIESAPFSIRGLTHSIEIMLSQKAAEKQLRLIVKVEDSVPDTLEGDATRLTQILVNLIGNGIKFTNKGAVTISIANLGISGNSIKTGITVADTGVGIAQSKLGSIFDRFQQAEDSVTRKYGGTGLGLSIVKDLVLLQNGSIEVESEQGMGTAFTLMIPYLISTTKVDMKLLAENNFINPSHFHDVFILVVEDNEINQSLIKQLFKSWHLKYDMANNGVEALEKLRLHKYDLVLMDIQMPEMDGYTAAQQIRSTLQSNIPIIAMTAHALAGEREKCLSYGMNEYISKPIREEQLHQLIAQFTLLKTPVKKSHITTVIKPAGDYQYINLQYMKEISGGNQDYEKTVTEQFMEVIPEDLPAIEKAWTDKHISAMRQLAHNMKTTVSVMGLNDTLQPWLDALEYEDLTEETFQKTYTSLSSVCSVALEEARQFYSTL